MAAPELNMEINIHHVNNYTFRDKAPVPTVREEERYAHMELKYRAEGRRTTLKALFVVHEHNQPCLLVHKTGNNFYELPGAKLRLGENEAVCLKRKLSSKYALNTSNFSSECQVGQYVATWWRPNFEKYIYPYCPPHITKPKERIMLFLVNLPERGCFDCPSNSGLVAIPFFELYDNAKRYGVLLASLPAQLSTFNFMPQN